MLPADVLEGANLVHVSLLELGGAWDVVLLGDDIEAHLVLWVCEVGKLQIFNRSATGNKADRGKLLVFSESLVGLDLRVVIVKPHHVVVVLSIQQFFVQRSKVPLSGGLDVVIKPAEGRIIRQWDVVEQHC